MRTIKIFILTILSNIWAFIYRLRRAGYNYGVFKTYEFKVPIISIGNITFGGSGKTPFTIWLGNYLTKLNLKVMVLTRGYKGKFEHSSAIIKNTNLFTQDPASFGDEPVLIAKKIKNVSVVIGKNRINNLQRYLQKELSDVILLDDGFQHMKLKRNLNIVLFDALLHISSYKTPPLGYLRENISAIKDADVIIITRADMVSLDGIKKLKTFFQKYTRENTCIASVGYDDPKILDINFNEKMHISKLSGSKVIAVSALASPTSFYTLLEKYDIDILEKYTFSDHHNFTSSDISLLLNKATEAGVNVVTTSKDMVKIRCLTQDDRIMSLDIDIKFLDGEKEFLERIHESIPRLQGEKLK